MAETLPKTVSMQSKFNAKNRLVVALLGREIFDERGPKHQMLGTECTEKSEFLKYVSIRR